MSSQDSGSQAMTSAIALGDIYDRSNSQVALVALIGASVYKTKCTI